MCMRMCVRVVCACVRACVRMCVCVCVQKKNGGGGCTSFVSMCEFKEHCFYLKAQFEDYCFCCYTYVYNYYLLIVHVMFLWYALFMVSVLGYRLREIIES